MDIGTFEEDIQSLIRLLGTDRLIEVLRHAEPGGFVHSYGYTGTIGYDSRRQQKPCPRNRKEKSLKFIGCQIYLLVIQLLTDKKSIILGGAPPLPFHPGA
jgi:hypothetical protein